MNAIEKIIEKTQEAGFLNRGVEKGVDYFARTGEWVTKHFFDLAQSWNMHEIDPNYAAELQGNFPNANVYVGDSFVAISENSDERFDLILADCPQGVFGSSQEYCEHFEFLELALRKAADEGVIFFNVNLQPYNDVSHGESRKDNYGMKDSSLWFSKRQEFYGTNASKLDIKFVRDFYEAYFLSNGFHLKSLEVELEPSNLPSHPDFIARCLACLSRIG